MTLESVKCVFCAQLVHKLMPGVRGVMVPIAGVLRWRLVHVKCLEESRQSRTTVKRP